MTNQTRKLPAVFLDRDGVLNEEVGYICRPEQLKLIPDTAMAIKRLNESGMVVVVVTNQSAIGREICTDAEIQLVNSSLSEQLLSEGAHIDRFYYCPHHPTEGKGEYLKTCKCRKPRPGMLFKAASDLNLDLKRSFMIGDRISDVDAGRNAGCVTILLENGASGGPSSGQNEPQFVTSSLKSAVTWLLEWTDVSFSVPESSD